MFLGHIGAGFANIIEIQVAGTYFLSLFKKKRLLKNQKKTSPFPPNIYYLNIITPPLKQLYLFANVIEAMKSVNQSPNSYLDVIFV